jgi:hypothetical protein
MTSHTARIVTMQFLIGWTSTSIRADSIGRCGLDTAVLALQGDLQEQAAA